LDIAALAGKIPVEWETHVQVDVAAPAMEVRDRGAEARANQIYFDMGIKSKHTIASETGLNYSQEQDYMAEEHSQSAPPPEQAYNPEKNADNDINLPQKQIPNLNAEDGDLELPIANTKKTKKGKGNLTTNNKGV
jgi:hypothetical protein